MKDNKGFTLVEMMIVVAIVGILAMFAVPAYMDYKRRTYVVEALNVVTGLQMDVAEYFRDNKTWPIDKAHLPQMENYDNTGAIEKVMFWGDIYDGTNIAIIFSKKMGAKNYYHRVNLSTKVSELGVVSWECSGGAFSPLSDTYLPPNCR